MLIYDYDPGTLEYAGTREARVSPLDGEHLIPAHSTTIEPVPEKTGFARVFLNGVWSYIEDHRGKTVYNTLNPLQFQYVDSLGGVPVGWTDKEPFDNCKWDGGGWVLDTQKVAELAAIQQKITLEETDIFSNLPSWAEVSAAINNAKDLAEAKAILKKLARVVYWLAKDQKE